MRPSRHHAQGALVGLAVGAALIGGGLVARDQITGNAATPVERPLAGQILTLINQHRARLRLAPLRSDRILASLARIHNKDMRRDGFFAHDHPQGMTFQERLAYLHRRSIGEVLAYGTGGFATAKGLVSLWFASPPHRRVLLDPSMRRIGISVITGPYLGQTGVSLATADTSS